MFKRQGKREAKRERDQDLKTEGDLRDISTI